MTLITDILYQRAFLAHVERQIKGFIESPEPKERVQAECIRLNLEAAGNQIIERNEWPDNKAKFDELNQRFAKALSAATLTKH